MRDQVDRKAVLPDPDVRPRALGDDGSHDLSPRLVAQGVHDPRVRMPPFQPQQDLAVSLVEVRAPSDQLADPAGRLAHHHLDNFRIAEAFAGRQSVGDVAVESVVRIEHARNAPLGVVAIALAHLILGDNQHPVRLGDAQSAPKPAIPPPMIKTSVK